MLMRLTSAKVAILWKYCGTFGIWFSLMNVSNGTKLCYDLQNITSVRSERATLDFWKCISFVTINLSISEGTCVIFLKALSAPICSNQFWVRPMQLPNVHFQNIQNENNNSVPGCWRLWRDTRHNETEAGRLRHWEEHVLWLMLLQATSEFIRDQDKRCLCYTCKDTSSGRVLALSFSFLYASGFPLHSSAKRILISVSAELSASSACTFTRNSVGEKGGKCRIPSEHQVPVEIQAASSQHFLSCWRTAIKSSHCLDSIHVKMKLTKPQRCLFLSFIGKLE